MGGNQEQFETLKNMENMPTLNESNIKAKIKS